MYDLNQQFGIVDVGNDMHTAANQLEIATLPDILLLHRILIVAYKEKMLFLASLQISLKASFAVIDS